MEEWTVKTEEKKDLAELKPTQIEMLKYMVDVRKYCLEVSSFNIDKAIEIENYLVYGKKVEREVQG